MTQGLGQCKLFLTTNSLSICMSYIALSTIHFVDFVHHLVFKKVTQCFENWIYCYLTWKGGEACTLLHLTEDAILNHWTTMPVNCLYMCDEGLEFDPTQQVSPHPFN